MPFPAAGRPFSQLWPSKDFTGRIAIRPFNGSDRWEALRRLQLGVSGGLGVENEPVSPNRLKTPATVPWFAVKWTRGQFNWEHAWFDDPVRLGVAPRPFLKNQDTLLARFQFIF